jgi:hypothetical protein
VAGRVDGTRWRRFFLQYEVRTLPALLLFDVARELYWVRALPPGDEEVRREVRQLLERIAEGSVTMLPMRPR